MFFFSSRRRHTRYWRDWSSDVCSSDLSAPARMAWTSKKPSARRGALARTAPRGKEARTSSARMTLVSSIRSEERRGGKECRSWWSPYHLKKKKNHDPRDIFAPRYRLHR